jgi:hypothetical protein
MAQTWKYLFGLGLVGAALSAACTVTTSDDDSTGGTGGTIVETGGSSTTGGTGGTTGGTTSSGGTGGTTSTGGTGGTTGGSAGTGGSTSGSGGTSGLPKPVCDPIENAKPYPDCKPSDQSADDACALCEQKSCCTEVMNCRSYDPSGNVCAWGGPLNDPDYGGAGEIGCMVTCLSEYVTTNEVCDSEGIDMCTSMCQTEMCNTIGTATNDLFNCIQDNCANDCFGADTCG